MKLKKDQKAIAPTGNHVAVCFQVVDLGTQETEWKGEVKHQRKIQIGWELSDELDTDGKPHIVSNRYTFSSYERAKFRQHLESWIGRALDDDDFDDEGFDIEALIGTGCLLQVVHKPSGGKVYANINTVSGLPKGTATPALSRDPVFFSLDEDEIDIETLNALPDWLRTTISKSPEFKDFGLAEVEQAETDTPQVERTTDSVPF